VMRGPVLRILAVSLCQLLQRLALFDSSAHAAPHQSRNPSQKPPQRRRHDRNPVERWQSGNEAGPTSAQAGRGPPCRSWFHVVRESLFISFIHINGGLVKP